jgi:RNA polymerase sigma-70 factor (ECF subfamily)
METIEDAVLMTRFQRQGDLAAFETLFRRHRAALLAFACRLAGDGTVAEDVSQQTWLKVIDAARRGAYGAQSDATFRTWLCTLARNHYIDQYQRSAAATRSGELPEDFPDREADEREDPLAAMEARELGARLDAALRELPFEQREVIALWAAGMEIEAMQRLIGAPRDTILSRKKYALAKLRASVVGLPGALAR